MILPLDPFRLRIDSLRVNESLELRPILVLMLRVESAKQFEAIRTDIEALIDACIEPEVQTRLHRAIEQVEGTSRWDLLITRTVTISRPRGL